MVPDTCTLAPRSSNFTVPAAELPLVGSSLATALGPGVPPIEAHPALNATTASKQNFDFMASF
jgi:hypothetical protein